MKITVEVPVSLVVEALSDFGAKEQEHLDKLKGEVEKIERSILADPYKDQKLAAYKQDMLLTENNLRALELNKKIVSGSLFGVYTYDAEGNGTKTPSVKVELALE